MAKYAIALFLVLALCLLSACVMPSTPAGGAEATTANLWEGESGTDVPTKPGSDLATEPETASEPELETDPEPDTETETESETSTATETETDPETETETALPAFPNEAESEGTKRY